MMLMHKSTSTLAHERRARMLHAAQREINLTLTSAPDLVGGCRSILAALGNTLDWAFGELWNVTDDALARRVVWHRPDALLARFAEAIDSQDRDELPTIPREIIESHTPQWHPDIAGNVRFSRSELARQCGLHASFGFPLTLGERTLGAMVFFSREVLQPDDEMLKLVSGIGSQVAEFIVRRQAEASLRSSEERFRLLVDGIRDYALYMIDAEGRIASWNTGAEAINGYSACEIIGCDCSLVYTEDDITLGRPQRELELARHNGRHHSEGWRRRKNGSHFWANALITALWRPDGSLRGYAKLTRDMTEHRRAEDKLQRYALRMRAMSRRMTELQEDERQSLAAELHDRVGQNLTALNINLQILKDQLPSSGPGQARIDDCLSLVSETIGTMRDVMADLRPPALDDYGLLPALRWYGEQFSRRTAIELDFQADEAFPRLPRTAENGLFRIAQEALTNLVKHSGARRAIIELSLAGHVATLAIRDQGQGFQQPGPDTAPEPAGWGLITMAERADAIGARLEICSAPGQGTSVIARMQVSA